jgi:CheY-like chemotaxis protein
MTIQPHCTCESVCSAKPASMSRARRTVAAALKAAHALRPDLILLDVRLPDGDGRELCRKLASDRLLYRTPVLLISALADSAPPQAVPDAARGFLREPVPPDVLLAAVRRALVPAPPQVRGSRNGAP